VVTKIRHLGELNLNSSEELARARSQAVLAKNELELVKQELVVVTKDKNILKSSLDTSTAQIEFQSQQVIH
jgi:hypothetical protein